jgi:uncharacterized protein YlxP (DUF503 family)
MILATLRLELRVDPGQSSREKRRRMRAIMDKLHRSFNVSVAETDHATDPCQSILIVAAVGRSRREVRETLAKVADAVAVYPRAELLSHEISEV